jgi:hypothetical protein
MLLVGNRDLVRPRHRLDTPFERALVPVVSVLPMRVAVVHVVDVIAVLLGHMTTARAMLVVMSSVGRFRVHVRLSAARVP